MDRRDFLTLSGALACTPAFAVPHLIHAPIDTLVIVELDGGNDALNTVIPIADARYRALRPTLAVSPDEALMIGPGTALHPSMKALMPIWHAGQLAIVQGIGCTGAGQSHYRAQQIWRTASGVNEYRSDAWTRRISTELPFDRVCQSFARACAGAAHMLARHRDRSHVTVVRLVLHGFDTHANQPARHAVLLAELAQGLAVLRGMLTHSGDWNRTLVMTVSEFGRSAFENAARGTDHGAASAHVLAGGRVRGGLFGAPPRLDALHDDGGIPADIDFRRLYATALHACGHIDSTPVFGAAVEPLPLIRA
jgi:uncharacterized protein (DUF1501 family)